MNLNFFTSHYEFQKKGKIAVGNYIFSKSILTRSLCIVRAFLSHQDKDR